MFSGSMLNFLGVKLVPGTPVCWGERRFSEVQQFLFGDSGINKLNVSQPLSID